MGTARETWEAITQTPEIIEFLAGLFDRVGIRIIDNHEEFTCVHHGRVITFEEGIAADRVDYVVEIKAFQVERLAEQAKTGKLDEAEQYRVISALFTPATVATLKIPILSNRILRWLAGSEDLIHVHLKSPTQQEKDVCHTLIFARRQWIVVPGLYGNPGRVYRLSMQDANTYQRHAFAATKRTGWKELLDFSQWYRGWRRSVSSTA